MIGTKPYYNTELGNLYNADCLEVLKLLPDNCIDSCITDPPYGIGFMGKKWDYDVPSVEIWQQVLRILKPGGHILCACGTRTQHRMAVNLEDAGFEIRDIVAWLYGSGFPKSLDISKAIDKMANAERQVVGEMDDPRYQSKSTKGFKAFSIQGKGYDDGTTLGHYEPGQIKKTAPSTPEAKQWDGWGTALKPAMELFTLARKPLSEKTVAQNVLKHGVGGINIDECRVDHNGRPPESDRWGKHHRIESKSTFGASTDDESWESNNKGRFPANVILDEEAGKILDEQSGDLGTCGNIRTTESIRKKANINFVDGKRTLGLENLYKDIGGASRFFY